MYWMASDRIRADCKQMSQTLHSTGAESRSMAEAQEVDDRIFDDITRTFVLDDEMRWFFEEYPLCARGDRNAAS